MEKEVVYVAELDTDCDMVAANYLYNEGVLKCVVCDPVPKSSEIIRRIEILKSLGIQVLYEMPSVAKYVFLGGRLTIIANYVKTHHIDLLVMCGGFVGKTIIGCGFPKYSSKDVVKTFTFNRDVRATDYVLRTGKRKIGKIVLVGKNVCRSSKNTGSTYGFWSSDKYKELIDRYHIRGDKRLHDLLVCHEGLSFLDKRHDKLCNYAFVKPFNTGLNGKDTEWGSTKTDPTPYRDVYAAVCFRFCPGICSIIKELR